MADGNQETEVGHTAGDIFGLLCSPSHARQEYYTPCYTNSGYAMPPFCDSFVNDKMIKGKKFIFT